MFDYLRTHDTEYRKHTAEIDAQLTKMAADDRNQVEEAITDITHAAQVVAMTAYTLGVVDRSKADVQVSESDWAMWEAVQAIRQRNNDEEELYDFIVELSLEDPEAPLLQMLRQEYRKWKSAHRPTKN